MDVEYELRGIRFRWDQDKATRNIAKHGISQSMAYRSSRQHKFSLFLLFVIGTLPTKEKRGMPRSVLTSNTGCFLLPT